MRRLRYLPSLVFFVGYLAIQCIFCVRSILSDVRRPYGFGMYTSKVLSRRPYRIIRKDGSRELFRMEGAPGVLSITSQETDTVLVYPKASLPQWDPRLPCAAHSGDAVAIEWSEAGEEKRFDCPG